MLNTFCLQGRLTKDPVLKNIGQTCVCKFTVAWNKKINDRETNLFIDCDAWGKLGEMVNKYFKKGQQIIVTLELFTNKYTDKDKIERAVINGLVTSVSFCGNKENTNSTTQATVSSQSTTEMYSDVNEIVPF